MLLAGPMVEGRQVGPPDPVSAIVVDEAEQPLGGVAVNAFMGDAAVTGADGRFDLKTPWPTMRFVVDGYAPATRLASAVRTSGRVVLVAARSRPTVLPRVQPDGRRYRLVGHLLETFHYENASPEVAAYFDRMLDAMCHLEPPFKP